MIKYPVEQLDPCIMIQWPQNCTSLISRPNYLKLWPHSNTKQHPVKPYGEFHLGLCVL